MAREPKDSILLRLRTQLDALPVLLSNVSSDAILQRPDSGKWSAHENIAHLGRYHEIFIERVKLILAESAPHLPRYRAEEDPWWPMWTARSPGEVLDRLNVLRRDLTGLVESLSDNQLDRVGVHARFGSMTLRIWLEFFLFHEGHHLYNVLALLRT